MFNFFWKLLEVFPGVSGIDANGKRLGRGMVNKVFDEVGQQADREVVYASETKVFEYMQGGTFTGAGASADDDKAHRSFHL